ncbi:MAG: leucine-rich repeat protein [bacterium]|nr:leucine-rich repeat protein [bacterium]
MRGIARKAATKLLALAAVFMLSLGFCVVGAQHAQAATDTITRVNIITGSGYSLNYAFKPGDYVELLPFSVKSVESTNGLVTASDLQFDPSEYYGWCQSYTDTHGNVDWIKYSEDGVQDLYYTGGESRFMVELWVGEDSGYVFADDCKFYVNGEEMTLYKRYNNQDVIYYVSRYASETTGSCGDGVTYSIDMETGTLTLSGMGATNDYGNSMFSPFSPYRWYIKTLIVEEGITGLGSCLTAGFTNCTSVSLPSTLERIGWADFANYEKLKEITLPSSVARIDGQAFSNTGLETINYLGTMEQWAAVVVSNQGNDILGTDALVIQGHTHNFVKVESHAATCGAAGYDVYECSCGSSYNQETEPATGEHIWGADERCTVCGALRPPDPDARSGKCGEDVYWAYDEESGVLSITGSGPMIDYGNSAYSPFSPFAYYVKALEVGEGVTTLGSCSTTSFRNCTSISLPSTLERIGWAAFANDEKLKEITLPSSVARIDSEAFSNTGLETINYMGSEEQWAAVDVSSQGNNILFDMGPEGFHCWVENAITKATLTSNGSVGYTCDRCGDTKGETIYSPATFLVDPEFCVSNGSAREPVVTVVDSNGNTIPAAQYSVTYSNNKNPGNATATVTFTGNRYEGTASVSFKIIKAGWNKIEGYWYYFNSDDTMATNVWKKDSKGWCYLGADGRMVTNDWAKDSKGWCWIGSNGYMLVTTKWLKIDGDWYHITKGYRDQSKWMKDSKGWCYLGPDGKMVTNGWAKDSKGWCWMGADGYWVANKWVKDGDAWYYIKSNHYMAKSEWVKSGSYWYYLQANGKMATGTITIGSKTYTFDSKGHWVS